MLLQFCLFRAAYAVWVTWSVRMTLQYEEADFRKDSEESEELSYAYKVTMKQSNKETE